jgi:hypothetical protein
VLAVVVVIAMGGQAWLVCFFPLYLAKMEVSIATEKVSSAD